ASASARCVLARLEPVISICTTPAACARAITASRSASQLSCARLTPISISAAGAGEAERAGEAVLWFRMRAHILLNGGPLQRSSPDTSPWPYRARRSRGWCCALSACALVTVCLGAARVATWRDIEARIQYGYYTEDASALR